MKLTGLLTALKQQPGVQRFIDSVEPVQLRAPAALRPFLAALLGQKVAGQVLVVVSSTREAQDLAQSLRELLPPATVVEFPSWETLPHERLSPRADTVGARLAILRRLKHPAEADGPIKVVVASVRAVLQPLVQGLADLEPVSWSVGDDIDVDKAIADLVLAGYSRSELVQRRGEFAIRGGIIDVFPPTLEHPLRTELWGDTVEEIRAFAIADQRSLPRASVDLLWAPVCRELV